MPQETLPLTGFKECDIRGEVGTDVTPALARRLGQALASLAKDRRVLVGGDFRTSTPQLMAELVRGAAESGAVVYDLGQLSTPAYYFARRRLGIPVAVMVTASHSPPAHNGFKPVLGSLPIAPEELDEIKRLVAGGDLGSGAGRIERLDIRADYAHWLAERFSAAAPALPKMVLDCGNGATGWALPEVLRLLQLDVEVLFAEPDGRFPNRSPDIAGPEDLALLQDEVRKRGAALGAGFDGDGDRVGFVDERGHRVSSDRLIAWLAHELLQRERGAAVIHDIKLSRAVPEAVEKAGGRPVVQKSGHTFIKTAMLQYDALFGGEYSGHLFYRELEGGDDGLFSALLVASLVGEARKPFSELLGTIPLYASTPDIRIRYTGDKAGLIRDAAAHARAQGARITLLDGVKAEYDDGWALVRSSVTEPALTLRFEGPTRADMLDVAKRFLDGLGDVGKRVWAKVQEHAP